MVADLLSKWGNILVRGYTRPSSTVLCLHTRRFVVRWPRRPIDLIDIGIAFSKKLPPVLAMLPPPAPKDCCFGANVWIHGRVPGSLRPMAGVLPWKTAGNQELLGLGGHLKDSRISTCAAP